MIINIVFTIIILGLALLDIKSFKSNRHIDFKSTIMSIGMLGTFVGIFIGLMDFNTGNLLDSVPSLLGGLKTAFYTSIIGMGVAILLSILQKIKARDLIDSKAQDFKELNNLQDIKEVLTSLKEYLASKDKDKQISLESKKAFELELKNELQIINKSLNKALETLSSGASKEIIKALESVILDFNNNLKEQFGDNFKELNSSTKNLLSWQESYKDQILSNESFLKQISSNLSISTKALDSSNANLEKIHEYNENNYALYANIKTALEDISSINSSLNTKLEALKSLEHQSIEALQNSFNFALSMDSNFKDLNSRLMEFTSNLDNCISENLVKVKEEFFTFKDVLNNTASNIKELDLAFKQSLEKTSSQLSELNIKSISSLEQSTSKSIELFTSLNEEFISKTSKSLEQANKSTSENHLALNTLASSILESLQEVSKKNKEHLDKEVSNFKDYLQELLAKNKELNLEHSNALKSEASSFMQNSLSELLKYIKEANLKSMENLDFFLKEKSTNLATTYEGFFEIVRLSNEKSLQNLQNLININLENNTNYLKELALSFISKSKEIILSCSLELQNLGALNNKLVESSTKDLKLLSTNLQEENTQMLNLTSSSMDEFLKQNSSKVNKQAILMLELFLEAIKEASNKAKEELSSSLTYQNKELSSNILENNKLIKNSLEDSLKGLNANFLDSLNLTKSMQEDMLTNLSSLLAKNLKEQNEEFIQSLNVLNERIDESTNSTSLNIKELALGTKQVLEDMLLDSKKAHLEISSFNKNALEINFTSNKTLSDNLDLSSKKLENLASLAIDKNMLLNESMHKIKEQILQNLDSSFKEFSLKIFTLQEDALSKNKQALEDISTKSLDILEAIKNALASFELKTQEIASNTKSYFKLLNALASKSTKSLELNAASLNEFLANKKEQNIKAFDELNKYFKNITLQYIKYMQASSSANIKESKQVHENLNQELLKNANAMQNIYLQNENLLKSWHNLLQDLVKDYMQKNDSLNASQQEMLESLKANFKLLDTQMADLSNGFAKNYEWFLRKAKALIEVKDNLS